MSRAAAGHARPAAPRRPRPDDARRTTGESQHPYYSPEWWRKEQERKDEPLNRAVKNICRGCWVGAGPVCAPRAPLLPRRAECRRRLVSRRRGAGIAQRRLNDGEHVPLPALMAERPKDAANDLPIGAPVAGIVAVWIVGPPKLQRNLCRSTLVWFLAGAGHGM